MSEILLLVLKCLFKSKYTGKGKDILLSMNSWQHI